jgi:hypothetical protein
LLASLARRQALAGEAWHEGERGYAHLSSPSGPLFARWSGAAADRWRLDHERKVRDIVGDAGHDLRAPAVLEAGALWLLERGIPAEPLRGASAVDAAAASAAAVARLRLPPHPRRPGRPVRSLASTLAYRLRAARPPLPPADLVRARRLLHACRLPVVTSHGDFHRDNLLFHDGVIWVVDWELSGARPAGFDLCVLWASLPDGDDRHRLFEAAVAQLGERARRDLAALRYSLTVRTIASKLASPLPLNRDEAGARALAELLPELRAEAGIVTART